MTGGGLCDRQGAQETLRDAGRKGSTGYHKVTKMMRISTRMSTEVIQGVGIRRDLSSSPLLDFQGSKLGPKNYACHGPEMSRQRPKEPRMDHKVAKMDPRTNILLMKVLHTLL